MQRQLKDIFLTALVTMVAFVSICYTACKKTETPIDSSPCTKIVCQNNGSCIEGKCNCTAGYEGTYCEKASNSRYVGNWDVEETIMGSSKATNINKKKQYVLSIKKGDNALDLLLDNLTGNAGYKNVKAILSRKYNGNVLEYDAPTKFVITANQTMPGTYVTIINGNGSVNETATYISCDYYVLYLDNGISVKDTINIVGSYKP